jgi:hypothetical protein
MRWSAGTTTAGDFDGIGLRLINPSLELDQLLGGTPGEENIPTGWATTPASDINELVISGKRGYLTLATWHWGMVPHWIALDSIQFYLNGRPFNLLMPISSSASASAPKAATSR